jgi:hypothetical protein
MKTQCERLLTRMESGPINPMQAWEELGIYRLSARAFDLRELGHNVIKQTVKVQNRFGESCAVAQYSLGGN